MHTICFHSSDHRPVSRIWITEEMAEWIFENIKGRYIIDDGYIHFQNDEDALAFTLRWI